MQPGWGLGQLKGTLRCDFGVVPSEPAPLPLFLPLAAGMVLGGEGLGLLSHCGHHGQSHPRGW